MANFHRMLDNSEKTSRPDLTKPQHGQESHGSTDEADGVRSDHVLYVWGIEEKSSSAAMRLAQEMSLLDELHIVDVRELPLKEIPQWLRGVPTLLSISEKMIWEGSDCLDRIEDLAEQPRQQVNLARQSRPQQHNPSMIRQSMGDGTFIRQRMTQTTRGIEEVNSESVGGNPSFDHIAMRDDKMSSSDMKGEVDSILQRRQMIFQQDQNRQPSQSLPTMDHRS